MTALTGGQKAKEVNIAKLQAWCATQSDEDYKQYVNNDFEDTWRLRL